MHDDPSAARRGDRPDDAQDGPVGAPDQGLNADQADELLDELRDAMRRFGLPVDEQRAELEAKVAAAGTDGAAAEGRAWLELAAFHHSHGDIDDAGGAVGRAIAGLRAAGGPARELGRAWRLLGDIHRAGGSTRASLSAYQRALTAWGEEGTSTGERGGVVHRIGRTLDELGEPAGALEHLERARRMFAGDPDRSWEEFAVLEDLAAVHAGTGDHAAAEGVFRPVVDGLRAQEEDLDLLARGLAGLGAGLHGQGRYEEAVAAYEEALELVVGDEELIDLEVELNYSLADPLRSLGREQDALDAEDRGELAEEMALRLEEEELELAQEELGLLQEELEDRIQVLRRSLGDWDE